MADGGRSVEADECFDEAFRDDDVVRAVRRADLSALDRELVEGIKDAILESVGRKRRRACVAILTADEYKDSPIQFRVTFARALWIAQQYARANNLKSAAVGSSFTSEASKDVNDVLTNADKFEAMKRSATDTHSQQHIVFEFAW